MLVGSEASLYKVKRTSDVDISCPDISSKWNELKDGNSYIEK